MIPYLRSILFDPGAFVGWFRATVMFMGQAVTALTAMEIIEDKAFLIVGAVISSLALVMQSAKTETNQKAIRNGGGK